MDIALAALTKVLASPNWEGTGGLDEESMYGQLAMDVANEAIKAEREACAALVDAWPEKQKYTSDRSTYGVEMATELADAIRSRSNEH
jgi:iron uptake system EfeUOB component EfeO/EfeM